MKILLNLLSLVKNKISFLFFTLRLIITGNSLFNKFTIVGIPFGVYLIGFISFFILCISLIIKSSIAQSKTLSDIMLYQQALVQIQNDPANNSSLSNISKIKNKTLVLSLANHLSLQPNFTIANLSTKDINYLKSIKGPSYLKSNLHITLVKNDISKLQSILQTLPKDDDFYTLNSLKAMDVILLQNTLQSNDVNLTKQIASKMLKIKQQTPAKISLIKTIIGS